MAVVAYIMAVRAKNGGIDLPSCEALRRDLTAYDTHPKGIA